MITFMLDRIKSLLGYYPQAHSGTTAVTTAAIDRLGYNSMLVIVNNAAASGTPDTATLTLSMVEGATSSPATAVTLSATPAVIDASAAAQTVYQFDLSGINRYLKVSMTPAFTGGTTPATVAGVSVILCDAEINPGSGTAVTPLKKA